MKDNSTFEKSLTTEQDSERGDKKSPVSESPKDSKNSTHKPLVVKVGIVGNRHGWNYDIKWDILKVLIELCSDCDIEIVSGGADGVDSLAQKFAKEHGFKMTIFYPDTTESSPKRFYDRNKKIADYVGILIAFNKVKGRSGTQQTINLAKKRDIKVIEYE